MRKSAAGTRGAARPQHARWPAASPGSGSSARRRATASRRSWRRRCAMRRRRSSSTIALRWWCWRRRAPASVSVSRTAAPGSASVDWVDAVGRLTRPVIAALHGDAVARRVGAGVGVRPRVCYRPARSWPCRSWPLGRLPIARRYPALAAHRRPHARPRSPADRAHASMPPKPRRSAWRRVSQHRRRLRQRSMRWWERCRRRDRSRCAMQKKPCSRAATSPSTRAFVSKRISMCYCRRQQRSAGGHQRLPEETQAGLSG